MQDYASRSLRPAERIPEPARPALDEQDLYGNAYLLARGSADVPRVDQQDLYGNAHVASMTGEVREILGERVVVASDAEAKEASEIITRIESTYGMELSSTGVESFFEQYAQAARHIPAERAQAFEDASWTMSELRGLETALGDFAPLFASGRIPKGGWLEVGKLESAMDYDGAGYPMESETMPDWVRMGETVSTVPADKEGAVVALFKSGFDRIPAGVVSNMVHELTHALLRPRLPDWTGAFWKDGAWVGERPPTSYGESTAAEDMSESFACWFTDRKKLGAKRQAWIETEIATWKADPAAVVAAAKTTAAGPTTTAPTASVPTATAPGSSAGAAPFVGCDP